mmetsp:Transcript_24743/g.53375  ORF Transcript_24743/g.53375 Transcript_24743/m.53375 type:complete len:132 (+) Transcript_24743:261-656(+)
MVAPEKISEKSPGTDAAKEGGRLLDILSVADYVGTALLEFKNKREDELPQSVVNDLVVLIEALKCAHDEGRRQKSKVSTGYLVEADDFRLKRSRMNEPPRRNMRVSESMWNSKEFLRKCRGNWLRGMTMCR